MSTKEEPGPFDGLERAEPNEPVFTLRAHDVLAAPLVHEWVNRRRQAILHGDLPPEKEELELIQCREAEDVAFAMVDWRNGAAPAPVAEDKPVAAYSGHASSAEELAAKHRYDVIKAAVQTLNNALAEVTDAAATLEPFGHAGERAAILAAADWLKAVANHIAPKRASYSIMDPEPEPFADTTTLQARVAPWLLVCFGSEIAENIEERNHRFLEEALELVQANGCTAHEAFQLVDYVFAREIGDPWQEAGGVMITLAALCLAAGVDMHEAGEIELARITDPETMERIRAKQAAKPSHSPLPQ